MAKALDCGLQVSVIEFRLIYYVDLWTHFLGERMTPPYPPYGLSSITVFFSTRAALALNNPRMLIEHLKKKPNQYYT